MQYGLFSLMTQRSPRGTQEIFNDTHAMVRLAEEVGFETAWFAEHHFSNYSSCASPLLMAARFAGATSRIKLGTGVVVLPLYNPIRLIEEIGLVDAASDGRLVLGLGTGYQKYEFEKFDSPFDEKVERALELIDIIEMGLETGEIHYQGEYYQLDVPICARPPPGRRPQAYVTGAHPALLKRSAQLGYVPFVGVGYKGAEALVQRRKDFEPIFGDGTNDWPFAVQRYVYVTNNKADARDAAAQILYINRMATSMRNNQQQLDGPMLREVAFEGEPSIDEILEHCIIGDANLCAERLALEIDAVNPSQVCCFMQLGQMEGSRALRSLERFGSEVIPLVEKAVGEKKHGSSVQHEMRRQIS